ncbi:MAG: hypothetical protein G01um10148_660 [Parcubacteria group bacterium Gr01-1014_8]|nr:MAG: hypothetical protein G01um10148_660 [Parcubacteria group bacterium Gr01-1014_8]
MAIFFEDLVNSIGPNEKGTLLWASAVFTAMEMCGSFITGKTGPGTTKNNFVAFCKSVYMPPQYHPIAELIYELFRNGVSHSYVAKGAVVPTADPSAQSEHLGFFNQGLLIYVPSFASDVQNAITTLWGDIKKDKAANETLHQKQYSKYSKGIFWNYMEIFHKLDIAGKLVYRNFIKANSINVKQGQFDGDIGVSLE